MTIVKELNELSKKMNGVNPKATTDAQAVKYIADNYIDKVNEDEIKMVDDTTFTFAGKKRGLYINTTQPYIQLDEDRTPTTKVQVNAGYIYIPKDIPENISEITSGSTIAYVICLVEVTSGNTLTYPAVPSMIQAYPTQPSNMTGINYVKSQMQYTFSTTSSTETITGQKTYKKLPKVNVASLVPTADVDFATKKYVDDAIATAIQNL